MTTSRFLDDYFRYADKETPQAFADVLREKNDQFYWRAPTSPAKAALLSGILRNDHSGPAGKLFLESRVLELLAMQLEECLGAGPRDRRERLRLTTADVERIRSARDLLVQDLDNPPSVSKLARMVGVNEKKLKAGFKQVFGQPVFEHFRDYRLERAREMLATGEVRVSEAAYRIGYQNLSHFSRAFRQRYGLNPKDYGRLRATS